MQQGNIVKSRYEKMKATDFKTILIEARKSLNLSVKELSEIVNVPIKTIYKWEQGDYIPQGDTRDKILAELNKRGAIVSSDMDLHFEVTYLKMKFSDCDYKKVVEDVLKIEFDDYFPQKVDYVQRGYNVFYSDNVKIFTSTKKDKRVGTIIDIYNETYQLMDIVLQHGKRTWINLLNNCFECGGTISELDIVICDKNNLIDIPYFANKIIHHEFKSAFTDIQAMYDTKHNGYKFETKHIISCKREYKDLEFNFYEKGYKPFEIPYLYLEKYNPKNYLEMKFKKEQAKNISKELIEKISFKEVLLEYIGECLVILNTYEGYSVGVDEKWKMFLDIR
jgi:DNA-binding transcriptional regulator YiaG